MEWNEAVDFLGNLDFGTLEPDGLLVHRQAVEARTVERGECLELVERAFLLEHRRIALERIGRVEDPRAAAGGFLRRASMRRAVGAEEEIWRAGFQRSADSQTVPLALRHRQTVSVRPQSASEEGVAIDDQVMGSDRRADIPGIALDEIDGLFGSNVLQHDLQSRKVLDEPLQDKIDELRKLQNNHALIGDVRGRGLFLGVELVKDRASLEPATAVTSYIVNRFRDHRILIGSEGKHDNILKIRPPLCFTMEDASLMIERLAGILGEEGCRV